MIKTLVLFVVAFMALSGCANARISTGEQRSPSRTKSATHELRILFVGNSLTGFNNMPGLFQYLANQEGHSPYIESYLKFGQTLAVHLDDAQLRDAVTHGQWDFVVLQEYSDLALREPTEFQKSVERFRTLINARQTKIVLFENWPYHDAPAGTMDALEREYRNVAAATDASIAPVGLAMARVTASHLVDVYAENDIKHPSVIGTYLGALSFLSFFYAADPHAAPHTGANVNTPDIYSGVVLAPSLVNLDEMYSEPIVRSVQDSAAAFACRALFH